MPDVHVRLHKNVLWLVLNRPSLNNLTVAMLDQLNTALRAALTQAPHLIVLTGSGEQAFCAGIDLPDDSESARLALLKAAEQTCQEFEELRAHQMPTVALMKGSVFGPGLELAVLCDTLIAHEQAIFRLPAINAKVFLSATAVYLPAVIGEEETARLMQSGETLTAQQAMQRRIVHQVLAARRFLPDAEELLVMLSLIHSQREQKDSPV